MNAPVSEETDYAYSRPKAFLPVNPKIPSAQSLNAHYSQVEVMAIQSALTRIKFEATKLLKRMQHQTISTPQLARRLAHLSDIIARAHALLGLELRLLTQIETHGINQKTLFENALSEQDMELWRGYIIYDRYFNVVRLPSMTIGQFAAQVAATSLGVLNDLPFVVLGVDEIIAIVQVIKLMFKSLAQNFYPDNDGAYTTSEKYEASIPQKSHPNLWAEMWKHCKDNPNYLTHRIAFYRWMVGHHFFDLCAIFCYEYLMRASIAFERREENKGAQFLNMATGFLRGTTAAMWYAGNFPARIYQKAVRRSMVQAGAPGGFSGNQNSDYNRLKSAKDTLKQTIFEHYGVNPSDWPALVYNAVKGFHEIYMEDMEQHILIAASKVGTDTSLAQNVWQKGLPVKTHIKNAVDVLRHMAKLRQQEFNL
jgi:hypothetical protein